MSKPQTEELVLPAPRHTFVPVAALFAVALSLFLGTSDSSVHPYFLLMWILFCARLVYLAVYGLFGHEVLSVSEFAMTSSRRIFGMTTRSRRFDIASIGRVYYDPPSLGDRILKLNMERGFNEGSIVVEHLGKPRRVAEGVAHDDPRAQELASELQLSVQRFQDGIGASRS